MGPMEFNRYSSNDNRPLLRAGLFVPPPPPPPSLRVELPQRYFKRGPIIPSLLFSLSFSSSSSPLLLRPFLPFIANFQPHHPSFTTRHNVSLHGLLVYLRPSHPHRHHLPLQRNPNRPHQNHHQNRLRRRRLLSLQATMLTHRRISPRKPDLGAEVDICFPAGVERRPFSRGGD